MAGFEPECIERSTCDIGGTEAYAMEGTLHGSAIDVDIAEDGSDVIMVDGIACRQASHRALAARDAAC